MTKPNFLEIHQNTSYKQALIDSLTGGITEEWMEYFEMTMEYVISEKYLLFSGSQFEGCLYEGEDETLDFILPCVRRVFGKVFVEPPVIFSVHPEVAKVPGYVPDGRLELFRLLYDIDDFIDYLVKVIPESNQCLQNFENIDKSVTICEIIVDNYIAGLVKKVLECDDIKSTTRDLKLKKTGVND